MNRVPGAAEASLRSEARVTTRRRACAAVALLSISLWLGGLVALGAIAAPIVFNVVSHPASADAMTLVFQKFDLVTMACAAVVLATEAALASARGAFNRLDRWRAALSALAAALAVYEATRVSPAIAALHAGGAIRGVGSAGADLARLHDVAEACGKAEIALLVAVLVMHVFALSGRCDAPVPTRAVVEEPGRGAL
ncbi:MAG: DUF4149 domain-containing protein [Myxococcota bacterium]|nr:DUF4149 domain-containing protein [Myxococcota bacterium]